jgi:hypothetical protein
MDVSQFETLSDLLSFRQTSLFMKLTSRMSELGKMGRTQYQILMREVSDTIQDLAMAYGERLMIEACINFLANVKSDANKKIMESVFRIFAIDAVKRELGFYLINGAVSQVAAKSLVETQKVLIRETSKNIN